MWEAIRANKRKSVFLATTMLVLLGVLGFAIGMALFPASVDVEAGVMGIAAVPVINLLGQKFGKRPTLIAGLVLLMLSFPASWLLFSPQYPLLQLVFAAMASPGLSFVWILTSAMMADVCDLDELKTGLRREGMYGAVFTFLVKLGLAGVMALSGVILGLAGFDQNLKLQTPETILKLRVLFMLLPLGTLAAALILTVKYPLSREKMQQIRTLLNRKTERSVSL